MSLLVLIALLCNSPQAPAPVLDRGPVARASPLERAVVVGASVSRGFRSGTNLARALDAAIQSEHRAVALESETMFFLRPAETGSLVLTRALGRQPTMIVAIDYLFWFGYGASNLRGERIESESERLELLELALRLLEPVRLPLLLGDFPQAGPAVGRALLADQVPRPETIERLNQRLHEWARGRERVVVLPLGRFLADLQAGRGMRIGARDFAPEVTRGWLQDDRLHATFEGEAALAALALEAVVARGWATAAQVELDPKTVSSAMQGKRKAALR